MAMFSIFLGFLLLSKLPTMSARALRGHICPFMKGDHGRVFTYSDEVSLLCDLNLLSNSRQIVCVCMYVLYLPCLVLLG